MGVKVPDFTSHMPMLHSFHTFSLLRPIVERHEETSARLPKLVRASAAPYHPIHLSVTSQTERDITSTFNRGGHVRTLEISGGIYNTAGFLQRDSWRKDTNIITSKIQVLGSLV